MPLLVSIDSLRSWSISKLQELHCSWLHEMFCKKSLWGETHAPKVVGSNPGTLGILYVYFSCIFVVKIVMNCFKRPKINDKRWHFENVVFFVGACRENNSQNIFSSIKYQKNCQNSKTKTQKLKVWQDESVPVREIVRECLSSRQCDQIGRFFFNFGQLFNAFGNN